MACEYFIGGQWVKPFQLKKMLAEGLLDQLIEKENLLVPETENGYSFEVNEEVLEKLAPANIDVSEVRLRIAFKANASKNTNTEKRIEEDGSISPLRKEKNINTVLEKANEEIEKENKKGKVKREKVKFLLATKIGGKVQFPNVEKEVRAKLTKELADLGAQMSEGNMYLLVPSSHGYSIVHVKTSFIGQTKLAPTLKKDLKTIFESKDEAAIEAAINNIKKYVHKFDISVNNGIVKTTHGILKNGKAETETRTWKNFEEASEYIFGKFDKKGNYTGEIVNDRRTQAGILAKIPIKQDGKIVLNSPGFNEELANNNFITTDLYSENGNFFHSSSFVIRALSINAGTQKELDEAFDNNKELFDALEQAYKQSRTGKTNPSKSDESPAYTMTVEDFEKVQEITFEDDRGNKITVTAEMQNGKLAITNINKGNSKLYDNTIRKAYFKRPEVVEFLKKLAKVDNKKQETLDKISTIQAESVAFETVTDEEGNSYYEGKELELERQTDANARLTGNTKVPNEAMRRGASVGNFLDILGRDILVGKIRTREEFIAAANEANKENGYTISITEEAFQSIVQEFVELRENLKAKGFTLVTSGMFVYENYNEELQAKTGRDGIGGTMDLVAVGKDGNAHILDFKNMRYSEKFHDKNLYETSEYTDKETGETKTIVARVEDWANQQTMYGVLSTLPKYDLPVRSINALPISTTYDIVDLDDTRQVIELHEATFSSNKSEIKEEFSSELGSSIINLKSNKELASNLKKEISPEQESKSLATLTQEVEEQQEQPVEPVDPALAAIMNSVIQETETSPKDNEVSETNESALEDSREDSDNAFDILNQKGVKGKSTGTDPGMDEAMRERSLPSKEDGTLMNLEEELAWVKKRLGEKVIGTVFNSLEDLQKYLPEETYEMLLRARKQGRVLHGIFTGAAMHLARNGFAGTGYHEAFHVVFNLALSDTQKLALLKEAREKYADELSENPTLIEIEELLADKFMEYVQAEEANAPSLPKKIARFFKALFRKLKLFFSPNSKVSIDEVFENISLGVYKNRISFENTDLTKIGDNGIRFSLDELRDSNGPAEIAYENPNEERDALEYLEHKINLILEEFRGTVTKEGTVLKKLSDAEIINKIGGPKALIHHVVSALQADIENYRGTKGGARLNKLLNILIQPQIKDQKGNLKYISIEEVELATSKQGQFGFEKTNVVVFKQPSKLITQLSRWLRKNGLRLNLDTVKETAFEPTEAEVLNENPEEQSIEEAWGNNHATIDPRSRLSQRLKRTLNTLEQQRENGATKTNNLGAPKTYSGAEVFGYLSGTEVDPSTGEIVPRLTDSYSIDEMMQRLRRMKNQKPFVAALLSRLEDSNEGAELKKDLFIALGGKTFQHFLHVHVKNGKFQTFFSNRKNVNTIIQDNIIGEFLVEANPLLKKSRQKLGKGNITDEINTAKAAQALLEIQSLLERVQRGAGLSTTGGNITEAREQLFQEISDTLNKYFIRVSPLEIAQIWSPERKDIPAAWQNVTNLLQSVESIFEDLAQGENPFTYQRPVATNVQTKRGIIEVHQSKVSKLASLLKPALEKEVVNSAKNVENKSVYSVQYANFLKKKFQQLKDPDKIQEFMNQIANDPVMSNMPLLAELLESEALRQDLHAGVLDGLTRKGKRRGVKYAKMSDAEITSVDLALWNNQSRYKLPIPSDSGTIAYVKLRKYTKEEIVQNLVQVARGEIGRIQLLNDKEKSKELRKISNYYNRGTKFQILSFLNNKLDFNNLPADLDLELTRLIEDFIEKEFFPNEIQKFKDRGIIIAESEKGNLTFKDGIIDVTYNSKATENFKDYLLNQFYVNTQLSTIFGGDPSFYKSTTFYQKRYKQVLSPGQYTIEGSIAPTYNAIILNDSIIKESQENIDNIVKFIEKSDLTDNKKKELIALWKSAAHNETDGSTFISLDRYLDILTSLNRLTDKHLKAAERIRKGIEHPEDIALFPPLKPFLYTQRKVGDTLVPMQVKNSEVLLTKNMASKHPKLQAVWDIMNNPNTLAGQTDLGVVESVIFESAVKVGGVGESVDAKGKVRFNEFVEQADGSFALKVDNPQIITINHEDWKLQQETPNHAIDEIGNYGSQIRHLAIADLDLESDEIIFDGKTAKEIAREYQDLIIENLKKSFKGIQSLFLDSDGEINYERLVAELEREMLDRDMEQDYFDAIELVDIMVDGKKTGKKKTALPLWHPLISYKVESLLNSFFANRITKQKINGGNMVNATSYGVSDNLEFRVDEKNGTIYMEALLPAWSKKFFPKDSNGEISEEMFERIEKEAPELLNIIGYRIPTEDKYSMFNIKVVGFTDSTSGGTIILPPQITTLAGLDFDIDKLFMMIPDFYIDKNGNPKYIKPLTANSTKKEMADYISKSFRETSNFIRDHVENEEEAERLLELARKKAIKKGEISKLKLTPEETAQANLILARIENQKKEILAETQSLSRKKSLEKTLDELYSELDDLSIEIYQKDIEELSKAIEGIIKKKGLKYQELMSTSSRNNRIIEILRGILSSSQASKSILEPGSFDNLKEKAHYIRLKKSGNNTLIKKADKLKADFSSNKINILEYRESLQKLIDELDEVDFNINYPSTQIELFRRNMTGAELIGIFANQNVHHAKSQHVSNFGINTPVVFNDIMFDSLTDERNYLGERISRGLATYLAASVDNASDPIASFLNINTFTADFISLLTRVGVSEDTIFYFMNQDVIQDLSNTYFLDRSDRREQQIINSVKAKWFTKLIGSELFTDEEISQIKSEIEEGIFHTDLTDEMLDKALSQTEENLSGPALKEYLLNQFKVLTAFTVYKKPADELGNLVRASKVDTKAVGPTSGYTFAIIDKQKKTSLRSEMLDSSLYGVDSFFFEEGDQKLNPAFYKWGIIMPTDLMNKIFNNIGKEVDGEIEYNILGQLKSFFANMKDEEFDMSDKEAYEIDTAFISFLASRLPFFHRKHAESTMKNLPDRLAEFKRNNPNSEFSILLDSLYVKDATETVPFRTIQYYNTGKQSLDNDYVRRVWGNMIESSNKEARELATELIRYTYFSSGYAFSPFSFFHLVPVKFWTDSFANKNENIGLKNTKGQTFNEILETALEEVNSSNNIYTPLILRFITQYAQNKAEKSTLLKNHNLDENFNRPYAPAKKVNELTEDEVMIFPGKQNEDFKLSKAPQGKGQVAYVRSKLPTENKQELLEAYAKDLVALFKLAKENPKQKFYISKNTLNGGFINNKPIIDFKTARDILTAIHVEFTIPENIYFPQEKGKLSSPYDVRGNKSVFISPKNSNYLIVQKNKARHLEVTKADGTKDFVYVFRTTDKKGNVTLWKRVTGEHKQAANTEYEVVYEKLPQLGNSVGLLEFDAFNDITESILPKIKKGAVSNTSVLTDEDRMILESQEELKKGDKSISKGIEISEAKEGGVPIDPEEQEGIPPIEAIDENEPSFGLGWTSGKKGKTTSELSEEDFISLGSLDRWTKYAKRVEGPLKFNDFKELTDEEQYQMYKCKIS